jgi:hypothetical protein
LDVFKILSIDKQIDTPISDHQKNVVKTDLKSHQQQPGDINLDFVYKTSLNITVNAPLIILPQNSK